MFHVPEKYRIREGFMGSDDTEGNNGAFSIRLSDFPGIGKHKLSVIASDGMGWEHVSVSISKKNRTPSWFEMCYVKGMFWDEEDCVIQYHPSKSDYVNCHQFTLHLWRPIDQEIPRPPTVLVGPK